MTDHQVGELIERLANDGFESVVFGGGEPLLWKGDLQAAASLAHEAGLMVQLCTNGTNRSRLIRLLPDLDRVILPLEAATARPHDALRKSGHSHFAKVTELLEVFMKMGVDTTISTVVNKLNIDGLPELRSLLLRLAERGLPIHAWHLYRFLAIGRGGLPAGDELNITMNRYWQETNALRRSDSPFALYRRPHMLRSKCVEYFWIEDGQVRLGSDNC